MECAAIFQNTPKLFISHVFYLFQIHFTVNEIDVGIVEDDILQRLEKNIGEVVDPECYVDFA